MKNFLRFLREWPLPNRGDIVQAFKTIHGKKRIILNVAIILTTILGIALLLRVNEYVSVRVPIAGGTITEGVVGVPRFINPVLAVSDTDRDIVQLVYSGLMKRLSNGELVPDLAEEYAITSDGLTYTFTIRTNAIFHDGTPVTTDDILYTINQIQNPDIGSPRRSSWTGITTKKIDDRTVSFTLPKAFGPFLEAATIGILPSHRWKETTPETFGFLNLNTEPVGSGPYQFSSFERKRNGIPTAYTLTRFNQYALGAPYIKKIILRMYGNQEELAKALVNREVKNAAALSPEAVAKFNRKKITIHTTVLPRVFGMFLNSNQEQLFTDKTLVSLLDEAINKDELINSVFGEYARRIDGPVPFQQVLDSGEKPPARSSEEIQKAFEKLGWVKNESGILEKKATKKPLSFSLTTADTPELVRVANEIRDRLAPYGIVVDLKIYDLSNLSQNAIQPRNFDALLFGHAIENEAALYAFWHSSQRSYPGLNITQYTNARADSLLESILRTTDETVLQKNLALLDSTIRSDRPAIFIYLPDFLYVASKKIRGITLNRFTNSSDRFLGIHTWYIDTEPVWKIFIKKQNQ